MTQQRLSILMILLSLTLTGCVPSGIAPSNRRSLERLRLVTVLGYDSSGGVSLSAAAEGTEEEEQPLLLWRSGAGFQTVMDDLQGQGSRGELYFAHTRYLVVGRSGAEDGLEGLLDYALRDEGLRLGVKLAMLKSGSAGDFVTASQGGFRAGEALASAERYAELSGVSYVSDLRETILSLTEYGAAAVCLLDTSEPDGGSGPVPVPVGYGILDREGKLAGTLEGCGAEALGLLLDTGSSVSRRLSDGTALRFRGSTELHPSWNADGTPGPVEVRAVLQGTITEQGSARPDPEALAEELAALVELDLRKVFDLAVRLNADFPALGRALRRSGGVRFSRLPEDWLTRMEFSYNVSAVIDGSGDLSDNSMGSVLEAPQGKSEAGKGELP